MALLPCKKTLPHSGLAASHQEPVPVLHAVSDISRSCYEASQKLLAEKGSIGEDSRNPRDVTIDDL